MLTSGSRLGGWPWQSQGNQQLLPLACSWGLAQNEPLFLPIISELPKSTSSVPIPTSALVFLMLINQTFPTNHKNPKIMNKTLWNSHREDLFGILFCPFKNSWILIHGFLHFKNLLRKFKSFPPSHHIDLHLIFINIYACCGLQTRTMQG